MKHLPTVVSVAVLVWAVAAAMRIPAREISWTVPTYLAAQCCFALLSWWGLQHDDSVTSKSYLVWFSIGFGSVLLMAAICTFRFLSVFPAPLAAFVVIGGMTLAASEAAVAYWWLLAKYQRVPGSLLIGIVQGAILLVCGNSTLLTLIPGGKPAMRSAALALGAFWFLLGVFLFCYCVGIVRAHAAWSRLNHYIPMMLTIVAFAWLAYQLGGLQRETVKEAVPVLQRGTA